MLPKLLLTYIRREETQKITMVPLHIFEITIMKKSSPINSNSHFCHCQNQSATSFLKQLAVISVTSSVNKNKPNNQSICEKVKFDKDFIDCGGLFHDINDKNNNAIVIFHFSTLCV